MAPMTNHRIEEAMRFIVEKNDEKLYLVSPDQDLRWSVRLRVTLSSWSDDISGGDGGISKDVHRKFDVELEHAEERTYNEKEENGRRRSFSRNDGLGDDRLNDLEKRDEQPCVIVLSSKNYGLICEIVTEVLYEPFERTEMTVRFLSTDENTPIRIWNAWFTIGPLKGAWNIWSNGYQSWVTSKFLPMETSNYRRSFLSKMGLGVISFDIDGSFWDDHIPGGIRSTGFTVLKRPNSDENIFIGAITCKRVVTEMLVENNGIMHLALEYDGLMVPASRANATDVGLRANDESFCLFQGSNGSQDIFEKFSKIQKGYVKPLKSLLTHAKTIPVGWCSWYCFSNAINESCILANLEKVKSNSVLKSTISLFQIDDGFQPEIGDWLVTNIKFPRGLKFLADEIKKTGMVAGLWLAPFLVSRRSKLYKEHPEWVLRETLNPRKEVLGHINPGWKGFVYCLDLSHPEVQEFLIQVFQTLCDMGFDYFKLDFLSSAMRRGLYYDTTKTRTEIYIDTMRLIRRVIGPDRFLLGCGAPMAPSIQANMMECVFDSMRIARDTERMWYTYASWSFIAPDWTLPSGGLALQGSRQRWFLQGTVWTLNDYDVFFVSKKSSPRLSKDEMQTMLTVISSTGGLTLFGDDLCTLTDEEIDLSAKILPPSFLRGVSVILDEEILSPCRIYRMCSSMCNDLHAFYDEKSRPSGRGATLYVINWADKGNLTLGPLDLLQYWEVKGEHLQNRSKLLAVFDFWLEKLIMIYSPIENQASYLDDWPEEFRQSQWLRACCCVAPETKLVGDTTMLPLLADSGVHSQIHIRPHASRTLILNVFEPVLQHAVVVGQSFHIAALADGRLSWESEKRILEIRGSGELTRKHGLIHILIPNHFNSSKASLKSTNTLMCVSTERFLTFQFSLVTLDIRCDPLASEWTVSVEFGAYV